MATKKVDKTPLLEYYGKVMQEFEDTHKLVRVGYRVLEYKPNSEDEFGRYVREHSVAVTEHFDTLEQAEDWASGFDPAPGYKFVIQKQYLRESVVRNWYNH